LFFFTTKSAKDPNCINSVIKNWVPGKNFFLAISKKKKNFFYLNHYLHIFREISQYEGHPTDYEKKNFQKKKKKKNFYDKMLASFVKSAEFAVNFFRATKVGALPSPFSHFPL
jgi:hypothetical protein